MQAKPHLYLAAMFAGLVLAFSATAQAGSFQEVETKTLDDEDFVFPEDLNAPALNIVLLAISEEQDNGTWQGEALVDWYAALEEAGVLNDDVRAWHFSVLKVPFFVKGLIRGGMADDYKDKLPLNQAGALFIKDVPGFAEQADIAMDGQPNIVLVTPDGTLLQAFKGEVSDTSLAEVTAAVQAVTATDPATDQTTE